MGLLRASRRNSPALLAIAAAASGIGGCGGEEEGEPSRSAIRRADTVAKDHLRAAYRVTNRAVDDGLTCSRNPTAPCNPAHFPSARAIQAEVGSALLRKLIVEVVASTGGVAKPDVTYIISDGTGGRSLTVAEQTRHGTVWVLDGSRSGYAVREQR